LVVFSALALALFACAHRGDADRSGRTTAASTEGTAPAPQATAQAPEGTSQPAEAAQAEGGSVSGATQADASAGARQPGMLPDHVEKDASQQGNAPAQTIVGRVAKLEGGSLTVKATELADPHELSLGDDTRILHQGETVSREQLQQGDLVRASYVGEERSGRATEIVVIQKGSGSQGTSAPASSSTTGR
jgi:hypothetical protein